MANKIIGIDLGTTNSVVSVYDLETGTSVILENTEGQRTTPSAVAFKNDEIIIGGAAKRQAATNKNVVLSAKRSIGTNKKFTINGKEYAPEQISGYVLGYIKLFAEEKLGEQINRAVITVPAYFNDAQRKATIDAGSIAGLNVERIINEPTAAALAYGFSKNLKSKKEKVLVYDLGGGTFDVSILDLKNGEYNVLATSGINTLGGDDFDDRVVEWLIKTIKENDNVDLSKDDMAIKRMKEEAEKAKINLSSQFEAEINLPFIAQVNGEPFSTSISLTRSKFEILISDLLEKTIKPIKDSLSDANLSVDDIDEILLVGGSTRIPAVQNLIKNELGKEPNKTVNPDEIVAMGAAIQGAMISNEINNVLLTDVVSLSLGIETSGGNFAKLIERNTKLPTSETKIFSTVIDNQKSVKISVYQGEGTKTESNQLLGDFEFSGIKKAKAGIPRIDVTFDIDRDGIVSVTARDSKTKKEQKIVVSVNGTLSENEIKLYTEDAQKAIEAAKIKRRNSEIKNRAEKYLDSLNNTLTNKKDKMNQIEIQSIQMIHDTVQSLIKTEKWEELDKTLDDLEKNIFKTLGKSLSKKMEEWFPKIFKK